MLIVTHSSIETFRTCHKKYFWEYDKCIKPKRKSWALIDGDAVHRGLEWLYKGRISLMDPKVEKMPPEGANRREWPSLEGFETQLKEIYGEKEDNEETYIHKEMSKSLLLGYVEAYPPDEFDSFNPEAKDSITVTNTYMREGSFVLAFKTDAILGKAGKTYLFETKTTSANSMEQFLDSLRLDDQPDTYLYGFRTLGVPAECVIYNVLRKPRHRQNKFESTEAFVARVRKAIIGDGGLPVEERKYFFRESIYRDPKALATYEEDIKKVTSDMEGYMDYRAPKRCSFMYGEKCSYLPLCEGSDAPELFTAKKALHEELA